MITSVKKNSILLSLLILGVVGYFILQKSHAAEKPLIAATPAEHKSADTLRFAVGAPQLSYIRIMPVEAYPEPLVEPFNARIAYDDNRTARVFASVAGRVVKIIADVGYQVKKGDALLVMDAPDYAQAVADNNRAEADLQLKQQVLARAKQLLAANGMAQKDMESAESDARQAEAEATRAHARLKNLNLDKTSGQYVLVAPRSGVISERQVSADSEITPGATVPLFVITDPQHVWGMIDLPEQDVDKIRLGQSVVVDVDAYSDAYFSGKVTAIGGALDSVTRRIQVRCEIVNSRFKLKPEMYARVAPVASISDSLPRIPNTSIVTQGLYSYVFVENSPGVLQRRKVELGLQGHENSFVRNGLIRGERVVTTGALLLNAELTGTD